MTKREYFLSHTVYRDVLWTALQHYARSEYDTGLLEWVAAKCGLTRRVRAWWFDESDRALYRRCVSFLASRE